MLALLLASWIVSAQSYLFKHLEVSDGLSNNSVNTIYKDRDGFMWFGTTTGLNRYDGYTFKIYQHARMSRDLYRIITLPILWKCLTDGFG